MKKIILLIVLFITSLSFAQLPPANFSDGIQTNHVILDTLTTTQKLALPQTKGTQVYDVTLNELQHFDGTDWVSGGTTALPNREMAYGNATGDGITSHANIQAYGSSGWIKLNDGASNTSNLYANRLESRYVNDYAALYYNKLRYYDDVNGSYDILKPTSFTNGVTLSFPNLTANATVATLSNLSSYAALSGTQTFIGENSFDNQINLLPINSVSARAGYNSTYFLANNLFGLSKLGSTISLGVDYNTITAPRIITMPDEDVDLNDISALKDGKADKSNVLALDNTSAYTPTANYHPVTKIYSDSKTLGQLSNVTLSGLPYTGTHILKLKDDDVTWENVDLETLGTSFGWGGGDFSEFMTSTGTRAGGDLVTTIGDYDNTDSSFKASFNSALGDYQFGDVDGIDVGFTSASLGSQEAFRVGLKSSTTVWDDYIDIFYNTIKSTNSTTAFTTSIVFSPSTQNNTLSLPNASGTVALTSQAVPTGGTTGQVLAKASATDNDVEWVTSSGSGDVTRAYDDDGFTSTGTAGGGDITVLLGNTTHINIDTSTDAINYTASVGGHEFDGIITANQGVDFSSSKLTNVANGTNPSDGTNKSQLDAAVLSAGANPNITRVSTLAELQAAPTNAIVELIGTIDCAAGDIDVSTKNFTLIDGGGLITNFNSFDLGDFRTDGNPNATFFDQSGTITGNCLDNKVYVEWFGLNKNADLITGGDLNGALPDHIAMQNSMAVLPVNDGTWVFPDNEKIMQGDGTNPDYTYITNPYTGIPNGSGDITVEMDRDGASIGVLQGFVFNDYNNLKIIGNGSTIIANPNQTCIVNNKGFEFVRCNNLYIEKLKYDGNIVQRDPYMVDSNPYHVQHAFGFYSCNNPILESVIATDAVMDGFYMGKYSGDNEGWGGEMRNCKALYNYRQGMSVVSHSYLKVYNSEFSFTGKRISTVGTADGRFLTTSPSAGVDMEANTSTSNLPIDRGQHDVLFYGCRFESNHGAGLAPHWGTTKCKVIYCTFVNDALDEPQDAIEETTGNNSYMYNTFINSVANLRAGGSHVIGNIWEHTDFIESNGNFSPSTKEQSILSLTMSDDGGYYEKGYHRKTLVKYNHFRVDALNANFPLVEVKVGGMSISVKGADVIGNSMSDVLGIKDDGGDTSVASLGYTIPLGRVENNTWSMSPEALTKYTGNVGRVAFGEFNESFDNNERYAGYGSLTIIGTTGNAPAPEVRGSYAKFSSTGGPMDGDDAFEVYVPNDAGIIKITTTGGVGLGYSMDETWFDTSNLTYQSKGKSIGATEATWGFIDPVLGTNPKTGEAAYKIVVAHDVIGNVNYETQIVAEWFGQNGVAYEPEEFFIFRNKTYGTVTGLRRVYDGGKSGNTASRPTTGGVGNYTEIKQFAGYNNTETSIKEYWNGTSWIAD